jgi:dTDP-4-dehydrorhamnose reductase
MKVLVFGSTGILGVALMEALRKDNFFNSMGTGRNKSADISFEIGENSLKSLLKNQKPDYVVNCIVAKQGNQSILKQIIVNSFFPLLLSIYSQFNKFVLIQISTNSVFRERQSLKYERSYPIPSTTYGFTKLLGEILCRNSIVIRTSFIGDTPDDPSRLSFFGKIKHAEVGASVSIGNNNLWNGLTSDAVALFILNLIKFNIDNHLPRKIHLISRETISKNELAILVKQRLDKKDIKICINLGITTDQTLSTDTLDLQRKVWKTAGLDSLPSISDQILNMKVY